MTLSGPQRFAVIGSALLALFLGAMDSLIMSAAMPTIVAELGGMHLYSWVYSAYFLARVVSMPIVGKLADRYPNRRLILLAIVVFITASLVAGSAPNMVVIIFARIFQGVGAGGIFALVYIVLADVSRPDERGKTLSLASAIWGVASVLGPSLGAFIVTCFNWRWIFFINIPLGLASLWGIKTYLVETRSQKGRANIDLAGAAVLTTAILAFLFVFLLAGRTYAWDSGPIMGLLLLSVVAAVVFGFIEKRAADPILSMAFFRIRSFSTANGAVFLSSFIIFAMFAYAPLFIQGAQGRTPMEVGVAMLSLGLGWSLGSLVLGRLVDRIGEKISATVGAMLLLGGCGMALQFDIQTTSVYSFVTFLIIGVGMGFVSLSTLLVVQASLGRENLGVATSSQQFARSLGGTVGVGVCGSFVINRFAGLIEKVKVLGIMERLPDTLAESGSASVESLIRPEVQALLPQNLRQLMQTTVIEGVIQIYWVVAGAAALCLLFTLLIPGKARR